MKIIVAFSGGKDSQASLIWAVKEAGVKNVEAVFCDTGWEHEITYKHVTETCKQMGVKLFTLKSNKYGGMVDMAKKKGRFPSVKARFCTEELKIKPMIDYLLDHPQHCTIIQGIRAQESVSRSEMDMSCTYFKYYFTPYDTNEKRLFRLNKKKSLTVKEQHKKRDLLARIALGKQDPKCMTYRKNDVLEHVKTYAADVYRPVFEWSGVQVINYILDNGQKPNPLYYQGVERVGCYQCIMCKLKEIEQISKNDTAYIKRLEDAEIETGKTFFGPDYIPAHARSKRDMKSGKKIASINDVVKYVTGKNETMNIFDGDDDSRACMSAFNICE